MNAFAINHAKLEFYKCGQKLRQLDLAVEVFSKLRNRPSTYDEMSRFFYKKNAKDDIPIDVDTDYYTCHDIFYKREVSNIKSYVRQWNTLYRSTSAYTIKKDCSIDGCTEQGKHIICARPSGQRRQKVVWLNHEIAAEIFIDYQ